ncbi:MAG: amidohydrolase family protein [Clostridiales bacterium]|nr:amidohydrolase family protein [Clostridiales bacterium]
MIDLLIQNVTLIDLNDGENRSADVAVQGGRIERITTANSGLTARKTLNGNGNFLFPGLIDFHTHLFRHGSSFGMDADRLLTAGVTFAVDMGTSGYVNYPAMYTCDISGKRIGLRSFINLSPVGQAGRGINEPLHDDVINVDAMQQIMNRYPGQIVGVKVRISRNIVGDIGLKPLYRAVEAGEKLGLPVCVHTTDPPVSATEICRVLRPGDIYSHVLQGKGNTILDENDEVQQGVLDAKERGVLMELGNGKMNFNFHVAKRAAACGFWPDIISSDATQATFHKAELMWDLPTVMSKFLGLGMPLHQVLRAVTETPATRLGLGDRIGNIIPGYDADLTICRLEQKDVTFWDSDGHSCQGNMRLVPETTIKSGQIVCPQ